MSTSNAEYIDPRCSLLEGVLFPPSYKSAQVLVLLSKPGLFSQLQTNLKFVNNIQSARIAGTTTTRTTPAVAVQF